MAGEKAWDSPEVKKVFDTWRGLLPYQKDALGRTWQEAAQSLLKESGMYLLGMFVGQQFPKGAEQDSLTFFTFPEIDPAIGTGAIEAPIDGFAVGRAQERGGGPRRCSSTWAPPRPRTSPSRPTRPSSGPAARPT